MPLLHTPHRCWLLPHITEIATAMTAAYGCRPQFRQPRLMPLRDTLRRQYWLFTLIRRYYYAATLAPMAPAITVTALDITPLLAGHAAVTSPSRMGRYSSQHTTTIIMFHHHQSHMNREVTSIENGIITTSSNAACHHHRISYAAYHWPQHTLYATVTKVVTHCNIVCGRHYERQLDMPH